MGRDELERWRTYRNHRLSATLRETARQRLLEDHLPLVTVVVSQMALSFPTATVEKSDLVQVGVIGLMDAFERFDPHFGVEFRTFASRRIRGQVLDELRKLDWIPRSLRQKGVAVPPLHSLEALQERKDEGLGSALLDSAPVQRPEQEDALERQDAMDLLAQGLDGLPPRERHMLLLYYFEDLNLKQIAGLFSLTESRVCQIHAAAVRKLKSHHFQAMAA
jgi:RNA polymerase sigma factor for flagellar operon FliA